MKIFGGSWIIGISMLFIVFLACPTYAQEDTSVNATVYVSDSGTSTAIITIRGTSPIEIPLPIDVDNPGIKGGLYVISENGIKVSAAKKEALIVYKTELFTIKQGADWYFETKLLNYSDTRIIFPSYVQIVNTSGTIDSDKSMVKYSNPGQIDINFKFGQKTKSSNWIYPILIFLILIIVISTIIYLKISIKEDIELSKGKKSILKTLGKNEGKIMEIIMENKGEIKRNKLEKLSGLAKSSLATSLNSLEKKSIIEVDKTYATHYIRITKWFGGLK